MNAISYINGDARITDFPACSARPLAAFVQCCNDLLAGLDGYLSPENSLLALELGWQTVGTADVPDTVIHAWVAELLTSPTWGVVRYAKLTVIKAILDIAELHRNAASGDMPSIAAWDAAGRAAIAAVRGLSPTSDAAGWAVQAAYQSTTLVDTHHRVRVDPVTGYALRAHALATGDIIANRIVELTGRAIRSWRQLAGLDNGGEIDSAAVHNAAQPIGIGIRSALGLAGAAGAAPSGFGNAQDTVNALQAQGYNVQLNGAAVYPLSSCKVRY
jgi:hypothetical protein